jgi:autotransporter-associated beta strand protein
MDRLASARGGDRARRSRLYGLVLAASVLAGGLSALGTTVTWTGNETAAAKRSRWDQAGNWDLGGSPAGCDVVLVNGNKYDPTNQNISGLSIVSLTFGAGATNPFNISGNAFTISGAGGITLASGSASHAIDVGVILGTSQVWTNNSASSLLTVSGPITNGAYTLTVAGPGSVTLSGALGSGSGGLIKTGSGTLTLSAANDYTGNTTIQDGRLALSGAGAIGSTPLIDLAGAGAVLDTSALAGFTLGSGQTLQGTGTVLAGTGKAFTVNGTLRPGGSIGTLNVTGDLVLAGTADFELGAPGTSHASPGSSDRVAVTGAITLGGTLNLIDTGSAAAGSYQILTCGGTSAAGSFSGLTGALASTFHTAVVDVPANQAVYVDLYNYAAAAPITPATIDLGRVHVGAPATQTLTVQNTAPVGAYTEALAAAFGTPATGLTASGSIAGLAGGGTDSTSLVVGLDTSSGGTRSGSVPISLTSVAATGSGLSNTALAGQSVTVTGFVYTGQGVWDKDGSGTYSAVGTWQNAGGVPGLDGAYSAGDTATFGGVLTAGPATVSLDGATPTLSGLTFASPFGYVLSQGSGGSLDLAGNGGPATVTVAAGSHSITAPVGLAGATEIEVTATADSLVIGAAISGDAGAIRKTGDGTLTLSGDNSYGGTTQIDAGVVEVTGPTSTTGTTNVAAGATLRVGSGGTLGYGPLGIDGVLEYNNSVVPLAVPLTLNSGAVLTGIGTIGTPVTVGSGVALAPGSSPGLQTFTSDLVWLAGGSYQWEVNAVLDGVGGPQNGALAGTDPGFDLIRLTDDAMLDLTLLAGGQFTIEVIALNEVTNWNGGGLDRSFVIVQTQGGIEGFDPEMFDLVTTNFGPGTDNDYANAGGSDPHWEISSDGFNLVLHYRFTFTPDIPEPSGLCLLAGGVCLLAARPRRRMLGHASRVRPSCTCPPIRR